MNNCKVISYKDLIVWQKSKDLAVRVYKITKKFPDQEKYGLMSQMRRNSISIPSNIAEGSRRSTKKDFRNFLCIAFGSGAELETQLIIALEVGLLPEGDYNKLNENLTEIMKILNKMILNR